jgi:hypothetical protein
VRARARPVAPHRGARARGRRGATRRGERSQPRRVPQAAPRGRPPRGTSSSRSRW